MLPISPNRKLLTPIVLLLMIVIVISACQPLSLKVEQISAEETMLEVAAPDCKYGGKIKAVEAVDQYTVRFTLCSPDPAFLAKIAHPVFAIQGREFLSAHKGSSVEMSAQPNGTGPYRLKEYIPNVKVVLEANPDYWGTPPMADSLVFSWGLSPISRLADLRFGNGDISDRPEPNSFYSIQSDASMSLVYRPILNVAYLGMNNQLPPFNDERVRKAISLLLDRQQIVNNYYPLGSAVADQFIPPALGLGYTPAYRWLDYNPKEGLDLLTEAGFDFDQVLQLYYNDTTSDYLPMPAQIALEIKAQLAQSGVKVNLQRMDADAFASKVADGQVAFYLSGWNAEYPDPSNFYNTVFAPDSIAFGNPYSDITFMAKEAGSSTDPKARQSRYNRINELIRLHVPAIPLVHSNTALVINKTVQGLVVSSLYENLDQVATPTDLLRFIQTRPPESLWPGDETDTDTLRITRMLYDTLVTYDAEGTGIEPALAEYWESNTNLTEWTFQLRYGIKFTDGSTLDANDVVVSFAALWDAASPNHTGRSGQFQIFKNFFGEFLNASE